MVAHASGVHHPLLVIPAEVGHTARLREKLGLPGAISAEAFGLMGQDWRFTSAKAKRELGYRPRPLPQTVSATVEWYLDQYGRLGMVPPEPGYRPPDADVAEFQASLEKELNGGARPPGWSSGRRPGRRAHWRGSARVAPRGAHAG